MSIETQNHSKPHLTILQVLPALKVGGVERGTVEFAIYLKQQGHRPIIVSSGGPLVDVLLKHQITHITLGVGKKSLSSLFLIKKLKHIMIDEQVDLVHARSRLPAWLSLWAIKKINKKLRPCFVTTLHGLHSVSRYSSIMARGDAVIAVSKTAKQYLLENFKSHLNTEPELIYRGVDQQFQYQHQADPVWLRTFKNKLGENDENSKTVLMPGRLSQIKGIEHLIPWLQNTRHPCKLLLTAQINDSNYSQKVHQLFTQHQLTKHLIWLGIERNMADLYASVDMVVSVNNKAESFGRTVLEALSVGTPVVAFSQGGVAEIMNELYPEGQVSAGDDMALSQRIDAFLTSPPKVHSHDKFSNQAMFNQTLAVYHRLIDAKKSDVIDGEPS